MPFAIVHTLMFPHWPSQSRWSPTPMRNARAYRRIWNGWTTRWTPPAIESSTTTRARCYCRAPMRRRWTKRRRFWAAISTRRCSIRCFKLLSLTDVANRCRQSMTPTDVANRCRPQLWHSRDVFDYRQRDSCGAFDGLPPTVHVHQFNTFFCSVSLSV